jgi:transcriptional regulator with XRE-family HTH domain
MFSKELSNKLLKIIEEKELTISSLAELTHISRKYMTNLINQKQNPSLDILENICSGLEINPDELLLSDKSKQKDKSEPMTVTHIIYNNKNCEKHIPLCPDCKKRLARDNQAFCDNCGRRLSWKNYSEAKILSKWE